MIELKISPQNPEQLEILLALFTEITVDGIREMESCFLAYTDKNSFESDEFQNRLNQIRDIVPFEINKEELPDINWNEAWEQNFDPVVVEDFLTIKADFHKITPTTIHTISINPKMSFGTGHHATTWMMVKALSLLDVNGYKVLDAGTGTGVLAILALKMGAGKLHAFDYDEWSYRNAIENFQLNGFEHMVELKEGSLDAVTASEFDLVLANINRNYLLSHTTELAQKLAPGGILVVSGFYEVDSKKLLNGFHKLNLVAQYLLRKDDWASIIFYKSPEYDPE
ncbi:MAG: 50S ribosomal protein L11 methyltransferase [Bacteroidetes bacterium]|nr:50S ribosomal protein L11 methyltransferase [Bacteroidota bacterium]